MPSTNLLDRLRGLPGVSLDILNGDAGRPVRLEHFVDEVLALLRDRHGHAVVGGLDFAKESGDLLILEGQVACQHREEDDPAAPDVDFGPAVGRARDHLRGCVVGRPARGLQERPVLHNVAQPEVAELDVVVCVDEHVFRLEVTMGDLVDVAVLDACHDLAEVVTCVGLVELGVRREEGTLPRREMRSNSSPPET